MGAARQKKCERQRLSLLLRNDDRLEMRLVRKSYFTSSGIHLHPLLQASCAAPTVFIMNNESWKRSRFVNLSSEHTCFGYLLTLQNPWLHMYVRSLHPTVP